MSKEEEGRIEERYFCKEEDGGEVFNTSGHPNTVCKDVWDSKIKRDFSSNAPFVSNINFS